MRATYQSATPPPDIPLPLYQPLLPPQQHTHYRSVHKIACFAFPKADAPQVFKFGSSDGCDTMTGLDLFHGDYHRGGRGAGRKAKASVTAIAADSSECCKKCRGM